MIPTRKTIFSLVLCASPLIVAACGGADPSSFLSDTSGGTSSSSASLVSDETETEAAYTSAVETLMDSSSSMSDTSGSAALTTSEFLTRSGERRPETHCDDPTSADQSFSCDNADGSVDNTVTFTDCVSSNDFRTVTVNGSFTNTVTGGGDGLCTAESSFDFANMVMGRDETAAVLSHETGVDGMTYAFTNARGKSVTVTEDATRTVTYTEATDADEDGAAESVTATVARDNHFVHEIDGDVVHDVEVTTMAGSFVSTSEEGTETEVAVSLPVHRLTIEDGRVAGRTIQSGELIVDHNLAKIRIVFSATDLVFDDTSCGPVSGTMSTSGYEINEDGSIGAVIGTGEVVFADGEVQSATFDGADLNLKPRPCI